MEEGGDRGRLVTAPFDCGYIRVAEFFTDEVRMPLCCDSTTCPPLQLPVARAMWEMYNLSKLHPKYEYGYQACR